MNHSYRITLSELDRIAPMELRSARRPRDASDDDRGAPRGARATSRGRGESLLL